MYKLNRTHNKNKTKQNIMFNSCSAGFLTEMLSVP